MLKRIIMHWTAGTYEATDYAREHYHGLVDGDGKHVLGKLKPEANISTADGQYVAHTRGTNTGSIGLSICAMGQAQEKPFAAGPWPITPVQVVAFVKMVADFADTYSIPITGQTVLTHAEVQPTLGITQRGKWDIRWLPGMTAPAVDPVEVGDTLRDLIRVELLGKNAPPPAISPEEIKTGLQEIGAISWRLRKKMETE